MTRVLVLPLLLVGCARVGDVSKGLDDSGLDLGDSTIDVVPPCETCVLTDANNYHYSASLDVAVQPGLAGGGDTLLIDWSDLTRDIHGHVRGVDFEIEEVLLLVFLDLSPEEISARLADDDLPQSEVSLYASCTPTDDHCALADFGVLGRDVDLEQYYNEGLGTWMALLRSDAEAGAHTMVYLPPQSGGVTEVVIDDATSTITANVDFHSLQPLVLSQSTESPHTLNWGRLETDGIGNALATHTLSRMLIARYDQPVKNLETQVFDLETIAVETWNVPISGQQELNLDDVLGENAALRIAPDETWLLALYCDSCANPAPKFVTTLQAEAK